jgi:hypothetical protein
MNDEFSPKKIYELFIFLKKEKIWTGDHTNIFSAYKDLYKIYELCQNTHRKIKKIPEDDHSKVEFTLGRDLYDPLLRSMYALAGIYFTRLLQTTNIAYDISKFIKFFNDNAVLFDDFLQEILDFSRINVFRNNLVVHPSRDIMYASGQKEKCEYWVLMPNSIFNTPIEDKDKKEIDDLYQIYLKGEGTNFMGKISELFYDVKKIYEKNDWKRISDFVKKYGCPSLSPPEIIGVAYRFTDGLMKSKNLSSIYSKSKSI